MGSFKPKLDLTVIRTCAIDRMWSGFQQLDTCPKYHPRVHFFFPHKAVLQIHESHFLFLTQLLHHPVDCHPSRMPISLVLFPNTGTFPDNMICSTLACFVVFSRYLQLSSIAVVPSLSALFAHMCRPLSVATLHFHVPWICSTRCVTCSILFPGKQTTMPSSLFSIVSVFLTV